MAIDDTPIMDEKGADITPKTSEIVFDKVDFSYADRKILDQVSLLFLRKQPQPLSVLLVQVRQQCVT